MKHWKKTALVAALALAAGTSHAHRGGPGMMGQGAGLEQRLNSLKAELKITPAQEAAWNAYAGVLQKQFKIGVSGERAKWVLQMQPLDARLAAQVQAIEIVGQEADIRSIDLRLAGGDRSLMLVEPLAAPRPAPAR